jgi:hypothetical protein
MAVVTLTSLGQGVFDLKTSEINFETKDYIVKGFSATLFRVILPA